MCGAMKLLGPLLPLTRNPFGEQLDPRDKLTLLLPNGCIETLTDQGVSLTTETRRWLYENAPAYACRVIESMWLTKELCDILFTEEGGLTKVRMTSPRTSRRYRIAPFITFEEENDALLFKLRWC